MAINIPSTWDGCCASQLKIVLLGGRNSGKSCVGNLILGKEEFVTRERTSCCRRLGVRRGRRLTVVDSPGWWCDFGVQDSCELVKKEIINSIFMCSPGPHALLVVVKVRSVFSEKRRRALEEHVALLGEEVWRHCMVVFTFNDKRRLVRAEELVERGGKTLRWLGDKCNWRCHSIAFNDDTEVPELLEKIQKLVTGNGNREFQLKGSLGQEITEEKRRVEERARQRFAGIKEHRARMRERLRPMTDIRIVLVGAKGSGKTSTFNTILGRADTQLFSRTSRCRVGEGVVFGRHVTVVDTPGWWRNYFCDETPIFDQRELVLGLSLCPPGPHVFLLVVRVDRSFTETNCRAVQEHVELMGQGVWARTVVIFSFGDWLGATTAERYLETEGAPLRWLVDRCNNRYHVINNKTRGDGFQVRELIGKIEEMVADGDRNWHYEVERRVMETLERKMRGEKERVEERMMKREEQRQKARTQMENLWPLSDLRLTLVGSRRTGKSSCGNTILGQQGFDTDVQTTFCIQKQGNVNGRTVTVTDTPGNFSVTSDLLTPLSAVLLVVNVSAAFRDVHREALERQLKAGGVQVWRRALVLFSFGDWLGDTSIEQRIESEGKPLQRLVERCGNRYYVLDNKRREGGAQIEDLMELIEEMLVEERMDVCHRGDHVTGCVSSRPENLTRYKKDSDEPGHGGYQPTHYLYEPAVPPPISSNPPDAAGLMAVLPSGQTGTWTRFPDRSVLMSRLASMLCSTDRPWWTEVDQMGFRVNLPLWFVSDDAEGQRSPLRCPTAVWVLPPAQSRTLTEYDASEGQLLCREWTLRRSGGLRMVPGSGGLQEVMDHRGGSSLEELEAFIDSYIQIWEQTMESCHGDEPEMDQVSDWRGDDALATISKKLSKLDVLDEIRDDLAELKKSLETSLKSIEEFGEKSKKDPPSPGGFI